MCIRDSLESEGTVERIARATKWHFLYVVWLPFLCVKGKLYEVKTGKGHPKASSTSRKGCPSDDIEKITKHF